MFINAMSDFDLERKIREELKEPMHNEYVAYKTYLNYLMSQKNKYKNLEGWIRKEIPEDINDIAKYGCQNGYPCITTYAQTSALYEIFHEDIWEILNELSEDLGNNGIFDIFRKEKLREINSCSTFNNLLVWTAIEVICDKLTLEGFDSSLYEE